MSIKEKNRFGLYIVAINITLILFMLTGDDANLSYAIASIVSAVIALAFNIGILIQSKKKTLNIISLILNIIVFISLIAYTIATYKLI